MRSNMKSRWKLIGALLAATPLAHAADETGKGYLMPQVGYLRADSDRNVDDDLYYGLSIGKHVSERWSFELTGNEGRYDASTGADRLDLTAASFDALRVFNRAGAASPFISGGLGYIENNPEPGDSHGDLLGQLGVGLMLDVYENSRRSFVLQLRPELKARWDGNHSGAASSSIDYMASLGFMFAFGPERVSRSPRAAVPLPPPPRPVAQGPGVVVQPAVPPASPRPTEMLVLEGAHFDSNSATLTQASLSVLDALVAQLERHPKVKIEVEGHTDDRGDAAYNLKLSQRRADAVRDHLIMRGITESRCSSIGYGEALPVVENGTPAGRAMNRRVVVAVVENPDRVKIEIDGK